MQLDPVFVKTDNNIEFTNTVLLELVQEMIKDEWEFMKNNKL
jgi:hypothetical protein